MNEKWIRTKIIYEEAGLRALSESHIAVFGLGGVGSYAAEAVLRSGVGAIDVYDFDTYEYSNFNRQLYADEGTVGELKVEAFFRHAALVNADAKVRMHCSRLTPEAVREIDFSKYTYVVDAIDDIPTKIEMIDCVLNADVRLISAMGAGNKTRPELLEISSIYRTNTCPLAKIIRTEAKKRNWNDFNVVYSPEKVVVRSPEGIIGSTAFVPSVMGLIMAGKVVNDIVSVAAINKISNQS